MKKNDTKQHNNSPSQPRPRLAAYDTLQETIVDELLTESNRSQA